jgi:hypothetical protein
MSSEDSTEPLIRVMALHALAYCERLFYLEEVEATRIDHGVCRNGGLAVIAARRFARGPAGSGR